ncbi:TioE family transcriptional regulator [Kitasatospora sp. NPDC059811]|uniref:TioE family transcriptional regulator n=1 Tax=Streptomycetaceae TaxID=2062 RepID=UPI000AA925D4|nr:TioE family transcriptional regulator [Streptomyces sp. MJM8645]
MRPSDLARGHGLSAQAVRNYERDGFLPPAERTASGYRIYTEVHAAALDAYRSLVAAYGHATGGRIMTALHRGGLDDALTAIDRGHGQLLRDRDTLDAVRKAVHHLAARPDAARDIAADLAAGPSAEPAVDGAVLSIGELAHRLGVTPATVRNWEGAGILAPARDQATGHRVFRADDIRDAELAHLLRRGGYPLDHIATVLRQVRTAGGTASLADALDGWQRRLTAQGLAMLDAAARLGHYLGLTGRPRPEQI